jgi:methyltransferase-like protein 6
MDLNGDEDDKFSSKISDFWQKKYRKDLGKNWNLFYKRNETRFFRDRHWISKEFSELLLGPLKLFEIGCGVGNFSFPLAELNHELTVFGCDISPRAIELFREHEAYKSGSGRFKVFVADIIKDDFLEHVELVDIATCIFVLSALPPECLADVVRNVARVIKPGGSWFIRDYASDDAAQLRFDSSYSQLEKRLFVRQDGTLAHYFNIDELAGIAVDAGGFEVVEKKIVLGLTRNVKKGIELERRFVQLKLKRK